MDDEIEARIRAAKEARVEKVRHWNQWLATSYEYEISDRQGAQPGIVDEKPFRLRIPLRSLDRRR